MIQIYHHDGSLYITPQYTSAAGLADLFNYIRPAAIQAMNATGKAHAIYGTKHYDPETGALVEADVYYPVIVLDDTDFYRRTEEHTKKYPGDIILAVHRHERKETTA